MRPEVTLPEYDGLAVSVDDVVVDEADVEEQVSAMRERFAVLKATDRPVQDGDYVSIDLQATVDGEEVPGGSTTGLSYEVGTASMMEGLDEALVGAVRRATLASSPPSWSPASSPGAPPTSRSPSARSRRRNCPSWTTSSRRPRASSTRWTSSARTCASGSSG